MQDCSYLNSRKALVNVASGNGASVNGALGNEASGNGASGNGASVNGASGNGALVNGAWESGEGVGSQLDWSWGGPCHYSQYESSPWILVRYTVGSVYTTCE